jgi:hypothetical protein
MLGGVSGLGKTTIAQNIAHQAVLPGRTLLLTYTGHPKHKGPFRPLAP